MEMARAWHDSDYAPFIKLRRQYSELDLILVEGTPRATTSGKPRLTQRSQTETDDVAVPEPGDGEDDAEKR